MGFGLLFTGYLLTSFVSLNSAGAAASFFGYLFVFAAIKKLVQYNNGFYLPLIACVPAFILSGLGIAAMLSDFLVYNFIITKPFISAGAAALISALKLVADYAFAALICFPLRSIAKETGAKKVPDIAMRNFIFVVFAFGVNILYSVCLAGSEDMKKFASTVMLPVWAVILALLSYALMLIMIFSCYRQICDENDVEMPQKPSRFEFVNKRREEKERRRLQYLAEAEEYKAAMEKKKKGK